MEWCHLCGAIDISLARLEFQSTPVLRRGIHAAKVAYSHHCHWAGQFCEVFLPRPPDHRTRAFVREKLADQHMWLAAIDDVDALGRL